MEDSAALGQLIERCPPPYRLTCDLALFPLVVSAAQAATWAGAPVISALGHTLLLLAAARYTHAEYGPARTPLRFQTDRPNLYRETACVLLSSILPGFSFVFPRLWLDTPDPTPLELGRHYGFPKAPATIEFRREGRDLLIAVCDEGGSILAVEARKGMGLPSQLLTTLAFGEGIFPRTRLRAKMRLESAANASFLTTQRWELPRLDRWGLNGRPWCGFWLEGAVLVLAAPERFHKRNT